MSVSKTARDIVEKSGRKQAWIAERMDEVAPQLGMNPTKLSQTLTGKRTMTAEELVVFCIATETDINEFLISAIA